MQECRMKFHTPACIKSMKSQVMEFQPEAVLKALCRRIYMMDCYAGIEAPLFDSYGLPSCYDQPVSPLYFHRQIFGLPR